MTVRHLSALITITISTTILLSGCGSDDRGASYERLSDIVPFKVIVTDFAEIDKDGVTATYRIRGSALLTSSLAVANILPKEQNVEISDLPIPSVDERSIKFDNDAVELLDAQRGIFTSVRSAGKIHQELFASAHTAIRDTASDPKVVEEAQALTKQTIEGFYKKLNKSVVIHWKDSEHNRKDESK